MSPWIVSPKFDSLWLIGGAFIAIALVGSSRLGVPIPILAWIWITLFDGPHIGATYTRTIADPTFWRDRTRLFVVTAVIAFGAGPLAAITGLALHSDGPFTAFLMLAGLASVHHLVRQHWGFVALYTLREGKGPATEFERWLVNVACWVPYLEFSLTHPTVRALFERGPALSPVERAVDVALWVTWAMAWVGFVVSTLRAGRSLLSVRTLYFVVTAGTYGLAYLAIAPLEPLYASAVGLEQQFLVVTMLLSSFHCVQYVALVFHHNRRRAQSDIQGQSDAGFAGHMGRSVLVYAAVLGVFVVPYVAIASGTRTYPGSPIGWFSSINTTVMLCVWWGLALHHYLLDRYIWRFKSDERLRARLVAPGDPLVPQGET